MKIALSRQLPRTLKGAIKAVSIKKSGVVKSINSHHQPRYSKRTAARRPSTLSSNERAEFASFFKAFFNQELKHMQQSGSNNNGGGYASGSSGRQPSSRRSHQGRNAKPHHLVRETTAESSRAASSSTPIVGRKSLALLRKHMGSAAPADVRNQVVGGSSPGGLVSYEEHIIPEAAFKKEDEKKRRLMQMIEDGEDVVELPGYHWAREETRENVKLFYIQTVEEADQHIDRISGSTVLGFDLEWRPVFQRHAPQRKVALVQLCDHKTILLFHIGAMTSFPSKLRGVLSNPSIAKVGIGIAGDAQKLFTDYRVMTASTVDLDSLRRVVDPESIKGKETMGLVRLVEKYLARSFEKKKRVQMSNWEQYPLSADQMDYAANDAFAAKEIFDALVKLDYGRNIRLPGGIAVPELYEGYNPATRPKTPPGELNSIVAEVALYY